MCFASAQCEPTGSGGGQTAPPRHRFSPKLGSPLIIITNRIVPRPCPSSRAPQAVKAIVRGAGHELAMVLGFRGYPPEPGAGGASVRAF